MQRGRADSPLIIANPLVQLEQVGGQPIDNRNPVCLKVGATDLDIGDLGITLRHNGFPLFAKRSLGRFEFDEDGASFFKPFEEREFDILEVSLPAF